MIDTKELIVGSYVASALYSSFTARYVLSIFDDRVVLMDLSDTTRTDTHYDGQLKPIPITPKILVQLGFKKIFNDVFQLHINDKEFEYCIEEHDGCSFRLESYSSHFDLMDDDCKYVHQVQKAMSLVSEKLVMGDL